jgi:hypothetical protein
MMGKKETISNIILFASSPGYDQGRGAAGGEACHDQEEHKPFPPGVSVMVGESERWTKQMVHKFETKKKIY